MAKFVKLEDGTYINIDKIIKIENARYRYLFNNKAPETSSDDYIVLLGGTQQGEPVTVTKTDIDNILKTMEEH